METSKIQLYLRHLRETKKSNHSITPEPRTTGSVS